MTEAASAGWMKEKAEVLGDGCRVVQIPCGFRGLGRSNLMPRALGTLHLMRPRETEAEAHTLKTVFIGSLEIRVSNNCTEGPQLPCLPFLPHSRPMAPRGHGKSSFVWAQRDSFGIHSNQNKNGNKLSDMGEGNRESCSTNQCMKGGPRAWSWAPYKLPLSRGSVLGPECRDVLHTWSNQSLSMCSSCQESTYPCCKSLE